MSTIVGNLKECRLQKLKADGWPKAFLNRHVGPTFSATCSFLSSTASSSFLSLSFPQQRRAVQKIASNHALPSTPRGTDPRPRRCYVYQGTGQARPRPPLLSKLRGSRGAAATVYVTVPSMCQRQQWRTDTGINFQCVNNHKGGPALVLSNFSVSTATMADRHWYNFRVSTTTRAD